MLFEEELQKYVPAPAVKDLYKTTVHDMYKKRSSKKENILKRVTEEIDRFNARVSQARELLLSGAIDGK